MTCFDIIASLSLSGSATPAVSHFPQCVRDYASISDGETCRLSVQFETDLAAGEFVILAGGDARLPVHYRTDLTYFGDGVNLSHWIAHAAFGAPAPDLGSPLAGAEVVQERVGFFEYRYRLKLVKSYSERATHESNEYGYSASFTEREIVKTVTKRRPMIALAFETSPLAVRIVREREAIAVVSTEIVAIVGGAVALLRICDAVVWRFARRRIAWI
jgi:hypothetical protein